MPADGYPIVGATTTPSVYVAVAHPGVALASSLGNLVAGELTDDTPAPLLDPSRPT